MTELQEYLVVENTGEVLDPADVEVLSAVEVVTELLEVGIPGPPGQAYSGGPIDMHDAPLFHARVVGFTGEVDNGIASGAKTLHLANGQKQKVVLGADPAITFDTAGAYVGNYQFKLVQDTSGGHEPTFTNLDPQRWLGTVDQPPVNDAPNGESILSLYWDGAQFVQALTKVGAL